MSRKRLCVIFFIAIITLLSLILQFTKLYLIKNHESMDSETDFSVSLSNVNDKIQNMQKDDDDLFISSTFTENEPIDYYNRVSQYENINFIIEDVYEIIREAYNEVDFLGEFKKGNMEVYDYYKEQYLKLLNCEVTFFDKRTQKEYYLNEFGEMNYTYVPALIYGGQFADIYDPNDYVYYFFDMDEDGAPELCVTNEIRFVYTFNYDPLSDTFILWHEIPTTWIRLLGSRKLWFYGGGSPVDYAYFALDQHGEEECSVRFYYEGYYNTVEEQGDLMYMVSLPQCKNDNKNTVLSENMKNQSVFDKYEYLYYFRVTEEQWNELTGAFFKARELAKENIKEVTYTYYELRGDF